METGGGAGARQGGALLGVLNFVLLVSWLAAPVLAYGAMMVAAPFFGELPTPEEQAESSRLAVMAAVAAFACPAVAAVTARRSRLLLAIALSELTLSCAAVIAVWLVAG